MGKFKSRRLRVFAQFGHTGIFKSESLSGLLSSATCMKLLAPVIANGRTIGYKRRL
jgi:hypothetical protein